MDELQQIMNQIPIRHNLSSQIMLLGVCQGLFVSILILIKTAKRFVPLRLLGLFILMMALVLLDNYLCYTGLMKYCITINDSTEPILLLWFPLLYLFIHSIFHNNEFNLKEQWYHFLLPFLYFISQIGYYLHPHAVKLKSYLSAYYPDAQMPIEPEGLNFYYLVIKDEFRWFILLSFLTYIILSLRLIFKKSNLEFFNFKKSKNISKYDFSKSIIVIFAIVILICLFILINHDNDLGDHYATMVQTVFIYMISIMIFVESRFFENAWIANKYETLTIQNSAVSIKEIRQFVVKEAYYLKEDVSLKDLSSLMEANPNYISKTINAGAGMNFNEFVNTYRIDESKERLLNQAYKHLTIEAIGKSVGFRSKSAFYNAFKKYTDLTPSQYVKTNSN